MKNKEIVDAFYDPERSIVYIRITNGRDSSPETPIPEFCGGGRYTKYMQFGYEQMKRPDCQYIPGATKHQIRYHILKKGYIPYNTIEEAMDQHIHEYI